MAFLCTDIKRQIRPHSVSVAATNTNCGYCPYYVNMFVVILTPTPLASMSKMTPWVKNLKTNNIQELMIFSFVLESNSKTYCNYFLNTEPSSYPTVIRWRPSIYQCRPLKSHSIIQIIILACSLSKWFITVSLAGGVESSFPSSLNVVSVISSRILRSNVILQPKTEVTFHNSIKNCKTLQRHSLLPLHLYSRI